MVECLGRLLNDMDQSVQAILMERAVQEQALFRRKSRSVSFIRRLSQRMSIFGRPKSGRNLLGDPITSYPNLPLETIEIVHSEPTFKVGTSINIVLRSRMFLDKQLILTLILYYIYIFSTASFFLGHRTF